NLFSQSGFGSVTVPLVHDSPNKIGGNAVYPVPDGSIQPIPEPATVLLVGLGALGMLGGVARRKRTA
ncbi:MAG: PEP-CTERM sorting domain-containing protein, partial [Planctomycetes bacterium]|nr:PEP-CTERM sorting domain-containing protein [Planctomycetota bacterium]